MTITESQSGLLTKIAETIVLDPHLLAKVVKYDASWQEKNKPFELNWFYKLRYASNSEICDFLENEQRSWWLCEYTRKHNELAKHGFGVRKPGTGHAAIPDNIVRDFLDKSQQFFADHPCPILRPGYLLNPIEDKPLTQLLCLIWHDDHTRLKKMVDDESWRSCRGFQSALSHYVNRVLREPGVAELLVRISPKEDDQAKGKKKRGHPKTKGFEEKKRMAILQGWFQAKEAHVTRFDYINDINERGVEIEGKRLKLDIAEKDLVQYEKWYSKRRERASKPR